MKFKLYRDDMFWFNKQFFTNRSFIVTRKFANEYVYITTPDVRKWYQRIPEGFYKRHWDGYMAKYIGCDRVNLHAVWSSSVSMPFAKNLPMQNIVYKSVHPRDPDKIVILKTEGEFSKEFPFDQRIWGWLVSNKIEVNLVNFDPMLPLILKKGQEVFGAVMAFGEADI